MEKVAEHKKTSCTTNSNELAGCEHSCERNANANSAEETQNEKKILPVLSLLEHTEDMVSYGRKSVSG